MKINATLWIFMKILKIFEIKQQQQQQQQNKQTHKQTQKIFKTHSDDVAVSKGLLVSRWIIAFTRL